MSDNSKKETVVALSRLRRETEAALRESERRLSLLVSNFPGVVYRRRNDSNWTMEFISPGVTEITGHTPDDFTSGGIHWLQLVHPDDLERMREAVESAARERRTFQLEYRIRHKDCSERWVWEQGQADDDRADASLVLEGFVTDITERKRGEAAAGQMAEIVESSDDAIISKDLNGIIASWNRGAEKLFGYTAAETIGKPVAMLIPPDRVDEEPHILERLRRGERIDHYETVRRRKDGSEIDISLTVSPVRDRTGKVIGASKIARDITERKRLSEQVELERSRLKYLFDRAPAFVAVLRGPEHVFELFNPAFLQLVGSRELLGKTVREALPEVEGQGIFELLEDAYLTGEPYAGREIQIVLQRLPDTPLEERFLNFVCQAMFEADGSVSGIYAHGVDVTEQVLARKAIEEANRLKDEFLATLSHEMRNPLNTIVGYSEVLLRSSEAKQSHLIRRASETIHRNAKAQTQLINDLLDLSRLQTGKLALEVEPLRIAPVIGDAVESIRGQAGEKEIKLTADLTAEPLVVNFDPVRVQQIVWNLVTNGVKFTPNGGRVSVTLSRQGEEAVLTVEDTGQGIDAEFLPHVFEMFRQGDASITRAYGGMGIGLALVRQLAELHGGRTEVHSEGPGRGARFTVRLPLHVAPLRADHPEKTIDTEGGLTGARILVVDDSGDSLDMLRFLLASEGATVETALNGEEGLHLAEGSEFDLVFSDISMPGMDGYEFIRSLRANPRYRTTPAIALTGFGRKEDMERGRRAGFTTHLTKPLDFVTLVKFARVTLRK
jgi:PAS domain S-box-containing protein